MISERSPLASGLLAWEEDLLCSRLYLNAHAAAQICGVSVRQLSYWRDRDLLQREEEGFGVAALNKALRIKRALGQGYTLQRAVRLVAEQEADVDRTRVEGQSIAQLRQALDKRLSDLIAKVRVTRQQLLALPVVPGAVPPISEQDNVLATEGAGSIDDESDSIALRLNRAIDRISETLEQLARVKEVV